MHFLCLQLHLVDSDVSCDELAAHVSLLSHKQSANRTDYFAEFLAYCCGTIWGYILGGQESRKYSNWECFPNII